MSAAALAGFAAAGEDFSPPSPWSRQLESPAGATGQAGFADVLPGAQFSAEIYWLAKKGISTGWVESNGSRTFRPVQPVNRDAMAAFLYRLAGSPAYTPPASSPFTDVPVRTQFYKEITWLASKGVSTGWVEGGGSRTFRPVQPVNRDAMAAFMYRFANSPSFVAPANSPFSDVPVGTQFYKEITWLASTAISSGWTETDGSKTYRPVQPVNRDAMAAFMFRYSTIFYPPVKVLTQDLPPAVAGNSYQAMLVATDGTEPYTWTVVSGGLPAGLNLDPSTGTITGTPAVSGTWTLTFMVTDASNDLAYFSPELVISPQP